MCRCQPHLPAPPVRTTPNTNFRISACQDDGKHKFSHLRLSRLPRTTFTHNKLPALPVRTTPNTNFRISACHGYPKGRLHASTGQQATTRAAAPPEGSVYCACRANTSRGPGGAHARRSSTRRLCVLRLPYERQPRASRRPRAQQFSRLCVMCLPHESQPRATRASRRPRAHNSSRRLCVMRLPHESQPRPSGAHARSSFARRLCVLRLPHGSVL